MRLKDTPEWAGFYVAVKDRRWGLQRPETGEESWGDGKLFKDIQERLIATAYSNDNPIATQCIIYGDELDAIIRIMDQLSSTKQECLLTIDRMNAEKASCASISLETLTWWRELLDLNPANLAPRIDAVTAAVRDGKRRGGV